MGLCEVCKKETNVWCARCTKVYYCSRDCQKSDWKKHKAVCNKNEPSLKKTYNISDVVDVTIDKEKGRVVRSKKSFKTGEILFVEEAFIKFGGEVLPLRAVQVINKKMKHSSIFYRPFSLIFAFIRSPKEVQDKVLNLFSPEPELIPPKELSLFRKVLRSITEFTEGFDINTLERVAFTELVNAFELDEESGGLFEYACRMSHSCDPNCFRTYDPELGGLVIRAVKDIKEGDELEICYLTPEMLYRPTFKRQLVLASCRFFICACNRCSANDYSRGFACPACSDGTVFLQGKIPQGVKQLEVRKHHTTHALPCTKCNFNVTQDQLNQLQEDEELLEYKLSSIVDNIPNLKSDKLILDLLDQCKKTMKQHWLQLWVHDLLHDWHKQNGNFAEAVVHIKQRIDFEEALLPHAASPHHAWVYEFYGDDLAGAIHPSYFPGNELVAIQEEPPKNVSDELKTKAIAAYKSAIGMLEKLFGTHHTYYKEGLDKYHRLCSKLGVSP